MAVFPSGFAGLRTLLSVGLNYEFYPSGHYGVYRYPLESAGVLLDFHGPYPLHPLPLEEEWKRKGFFLPPQIIVNPYRAARSLATTWQDEYMITGKTDSSVLADLVDATGEPLVESGLPSKNLIVRDGFHIGTESIGTDAWDVYKMRDGHLYRIVAHPQASPHLGRVFDYNTTPPRYTPPREPVVMPTKAQVKLYTQPGLSIEKATVRIEMNAELNKRREERRRENDLVQLAYEIRASQRLRASISDEQWRSLSDLGAMVVRGSAGGMYSIANQRNCNVFLLDSHGRPVVQYAEIVEAGDTDRPLADIVLTSYRMLTQDEPGFQATARGWRYQFGLAPATAGLWTHYEPAGRLDVLEFA